MNQFDPVLGENIVVPGRSEEPNSGVFCVVRTLDGYFRAFSHTMIPRTTSNFFEAAKYFLGSDCTLEEVEETAKAVNGHVVCYSYGRVNENAALVSDDSASHTQIRVNKMSLDGKEPAHATFNKSSFEQVEPSNIVCSACGKVTLTTKQLPVCPHCLRPLVYDKKR